MVLDKPNRQVLAPLTLESGRPSVVAMKSLDEIAADPVQRRLKRTDLVRDLRDCRRAKCAADAIAGLDEAHEIYGVTKGQFSLLNILESVRVTQVHAKLALFSTDRWKIVLRTSMNLNMNPRIEDFHISHDPEQFAFWTRFLDDIWQRQPTDLQKERLGKIGKWFKQNG